VKWGTEARLNRDTTYFGISRTGNTIWRRNGLFARFHPFREWTAHRSAGQPLPDTLSSLLLGFPYAYTIAVAPPYASNGAHIGPARSTGMDVKLTSRHVENQSEWTLEYGLRYELYTPISTGARTSSFLNSFHLRALAGILDQSAAYLSNRLETVGAACSGGLERATRACAHGGAITVIPPNIWQDNLLTGQRLTLFIRASTQRKTGRFPTDSKSHRTSCQRSTTQRV